MKFEINEEKVLILECPGGVFKEMYQDASDTEIRLVVSVVLPNSKERVFYAYFPLRGTDVQVLRINETEIGLLDPSKFYLEGGTTPYQSDELEEGDEPYWSFGSHL